MEKIEFDKINKSVNQYIEYLKHNNLEFYNNLPFAIYFLESCINVLAKYPKLPFKRFDNEEYSDVFTDIKEIRNFLSRINEEYLIKFDEILSNGMLDLETSDIDDIYYEYESNHSNFNTVHVNLTHKKSDKELIIHEFFHNLDFVPTHTREFLTEFIAIFFESLVTDNYSNFQKKIINNLFFSCNSVYNMSQILLINCQIGEIDANTYNLIKQYNIANIENEEKFYEILSNSSFLYRPDLGFQYIFGYILTIYIRKTKQINKEYINKFILAIDKLKNNEVSVCDFLCIIDIDISNNEIINDIFASLDKEIEKLFALNLESKKR